MTEQVADEPRSGPFTVALTGGVASGKTTVADGFAALGVPVFDTDLIAREVVRPGSDGFNAVVAAFGVEAMDAAGGLDRAWLRQRVFGDADARRQLEAIVHPRIRARLLDLVARSTAPWVLVVIPLLAETWPAYAWVDRVLLVDVPPSVQLERVRARDGIDAELAAAMLAAQAAPEARRALADDVIDNTGDPAIAAERIGELAARYTALAAARDEAP